MKGSVRMMVCAALLAGSAAQAAGTYRVQAGDNLTVIAKRYGLSVAELRAANPALKNLNSVRAGASLRLPDAHKVAAAHRVRSGETLSGVAAQYRLTLTQLLRANPGLSARKPVQVGKVLYIPARRVVVVAAKAKSGSGVSSGAQTGQFAPGGGCGGLGRLGLAGAGLDQQRLWRAQPGR